MLEVTSAFSLVEMKDLKMECDPRWGASLVHMQLLSSKIAFGRNVSSRLNFLLQQKKQNQQVIQIK